MASTLIKVYWDYQGAEQVLSFKIPNDTCRVKLDDMYNNLYGLIQIWGCRFKDITVKGVITNNRYDSEFDEFIYDKLFRKRKICQYYSTHKEDGCIGGIMQRDGCDAIIEPTSGWCGRSTEFPSFTRVVVERRGKYGVKKECDFEITDETRIAGFDTESGLFCSLRHRKPFNG